MEFDLEKQSDEFIRALIQFIYQNTKLEYVKYKNKKYYERTNAQSMKIRKHRRPNYDPDIECHYYENGICPGSSLFPKDPDKVTYKIKYSFPYTNSIGELYGDQDEELPTCIEELIAKIEALHPKNVKIIGKPMIIRNINPILPDHVNHNHCQVNLERYEFDIINTPCTLYDLMISCHRIKTYKWSGRRTEYCGALEKRGKELRVDLWYD